MKSIPSFTAFVLEVRYTFGYLAAGFLVSTPLWIISDPQSDWSTVPFSFLYGTVCLLVFFAFGPLTKIDWQNMKLPEFKLFELAVTKWSCLISLVFFAVIAIHPLSRRQWRLGLLQFLVMVMPYLRIKLDTWLFKDFYAIEERERRRVARARIEQARREAPGAPGVEVPAPGGTPAPGGLAADAAAAAAAVVVAPPPLSPLPGPAAARAAAPIEPAPPTLGAAPPEPPSAPAATPAATP
jgi:hypothetical protein